MFPAGMAQRVKARPAGPFLFQLPQTCKMQRAFKQLFSPTFGVMNKWPCQCSGKVHSQH